MGTSYSLFQAAGSILEQGETAYCETRQNGTEPISSFNNTQQSVRSGASQAESAEKLYPSTRISIFFQWSLGYKTQGAVCGLHHVFLELFFFTHFIIHISLTGNQI